ncbi:MAG: 5'-nucleotidase C-terminal domain-containing protein [Deltaproteobacteria bacterium]|nr:5'-nucleotidase C-terminal domain-containing protein [Deltaproteobacteria bacterium]
MVISVVSTNDLHGKVRYLPTIAGYVGNLRAVRAAAGGGVVLVDSGDMFQGTLESNLNEGAIVVAAYNAMGYAAAAIGNHEFDFGPAGEAPVPKQPGDDPRGALKARAQQAEFPFLAANLLDSATGKRIDWPGVEASTLHEVAGVSVGIIGVTTFETPYTTMPANFAGLEVMPLAATITDEARALRKRGAQVVVAIVHGGAQCDDFEDPGDLSSCELDDELFRVVGALPRGLVDVVTGGHTHQGVAHAFNGVAVLESYCCGRAFGRVDLTFDRKAGKVVDARIHPPQEVCPGGKLIDECAPGEYEGQPVQPDQRVAGLMGEALARAEAARDVPLGVTLTSPITRARGDESALGNLFADLMLAARPSADIALNNSGSMRTNWPKGPLTYGTLYESMPFDNRFATVRMRGRDLEKLMARNLRRSGGMFLIGGMRLRARCQGSQLEVEMLRNDGTPVADDEEIALLTSDYLASGGDGAIGSLNLPQGAIEMHSGPAIRDAVADVLRARGGNIDGSDPAIYDRKNPRFVYPGSRPVTCP